MSNELHDVEDVQEALKTGRAVRPHGPYRVQIGNERLEYRAIVINDPVPTGRQILEAADVRPVLEHLVFQVLANGLLEELRPDETTDLRVRGVEKFLVFRSDRSFRFQIDDRSFDWGASHISGATLKRLGGVEIANHDVWQDVPGGTDRLIGDAELADLSAPSVERFVTKPISITIVVNARPKEIHQRRMSYWEIVRLAYPEAVPSENIIYTVNYARGPHSNPEGSMVDGQHVQVKDGMTFYVTPTDKS